MNTQPSQLITLQDTVLIIVDVQVRLATAMPDAIRGQLLTQLSVLQVAANTLSIPIIVTEQYPAGLGVSESSIAKLLPQDTPIIDKTCFSCMKSMDFVTALKQVERKQVILTGMESHICILQTALDMVSEGYQVFVVADAVCSRSKVNYKNALQRMRDAGVIICNVESVVFEWLADAKHPDFKALAQLIA